MANVDIIDNCSIAFFLFRPHNSVLTKDYPYSLFAMPVESFPPIAVGLMGTVSQSSSPIIRILLISCRVNTPPVSPLRASQSLTRRYVLICYPQTKLMVCLDWCCRNHHVRSSSTRQGLRVRLTQCYIQYVD